MLGRWRSPLALVMCLTNGCVVGPSYKRSTLTSPPALRGQAVPTEESIADLAWWEVFGDETLQKLIRTALANNNDLRIAVVRIEQSRQFTVQAHAEFLPRVGYQAGISGGQNESLGNPIVANGRRQGTGGTVFGALWEADVWGRIRRSN